MTLNEKDVEIKQKEIKDIDNYFKTHPKIGDVNKPKLIKILKYVNEELAENLKEKYKEVLK